MDPTPVTPPGGRRTKFVVGGTFMVVVVIALIVWAMARPGSTAFYVTPSELAAGTGSQAEDDVRVNGDVLEDTIERDGLVTTFDITDGTTVVSVTTDAALPDAFYSEDGVEVVATGRYATGTFTASEVFAKCPSKFEAKT